jgi:hypothetical protein
MERKRPKATTVVLAVLSFVMVAALYVGGYFFLSMAHNYTADNKKYRLRVFVNEMDWLVYIYEPARRLESLYWGVEVELDSLAQMPPPNS